MSGFDTAHIAEYSHYVRVRYCCMRSKHLGVYLHSQNVGWILPALAVFQPLYTIYSNTAKIKMFSISPVYSEQTVYWKHLWNIDIPSVVKARRYKGALFVGQSVTINHQTRRYTGMFRWCTPVPYGPAPARRQPGVPSTHFW